MDEKRVLLDSFNSQLIKSDIHKSWLLKKFPTKVLTIALLYRASQHGWSPQDFHALCDNKGHTLTVLKSRPGKIFGGYTTKDWQSSQGTYVDDEKAFVFSIDKQKVYRVYKSSGAIYNHANWGPSFGGNALGLRTDPMNKPNGAQCRTNGFGDGSFFQIRSDALGNHEVTGEGKEFEDDKKEFTCEEIEVYAVTLEDPLV